ncbi:TAFII55 protein conserved region-domain-containing protein, partial [Terfezia claveryi]
KRPFSPGLGYDSEASDREDDPLIEEQFILRMPPGPDCTYLRHLIETKTLDTSSDVFFKFVSPRTAVVGVRGNLYSALLVDLPCILESVKTLDKKNVFKTADVCQMLLVGERVRSEEEGDLGGGWKMTDIIYPHGITPPLQFVRKRRFRKRVSNRTIEAVEAEVDRLLAMDQDAESSKYEVLDAEQLLREEEAEERRARDGGGSGAYGVGGDVAMAGDGYNDEDAEGEEDYDMDEDDLALQMESALMANPPTTAITTTTNTTPSSSTTPTNLTAAAATESDDEEDEEDDASAASASDVEGEIDESAQETAAQSQKIREEIADLEAAYKSGLREMEKMQNPIMRARKQAALERIVKELEFKMSTL